MLVSLLGINHLGTMDIAAINTQSDGRPVAKEKVENVVAQVLGGTPFIDIHTHLFAPTLGNLGLWGIDDLLTYHYLEAEFFRHSSMPPEQYWKLTKPHRADVVWKTLFLENTPISEAARGVVFVLHALGLDPAATSLTPLRKFFREQNLADYVPRIFRLSGVSDVVMTNDPLDPEEEAAWKTGGQLDERFHAALRLDRILNEWNANYGSLAAQGYSVEPDAGETTLANVRRFLSVWVARIHPLYMAVSLPDTFTFPKDDVRTRLLTGAVLPACREHQLPLALMIGVRRQVNPALRLAGDASGRADMGSIAALCDQFPDNRIMVSVLSRENQHELCVYARKFGNLLPFGCWWFLNNPSIVEEITRERLEMLGTTFIPQHSDARVLEQLIYKWRNTRRTMASLLAQAYSLLMEDGRAITKEDVHRDINRLFRGNFEQWTNRTISHANRSSPH
jgi:hypothetical protein